MVSCYKIYEFWNGKGITEKGDISDLHGIPVVKEPHRPSCFACGRPVYPKDVLSWDKYDKSVKDLWTNKKVNSRLQRCHILAKQFGGTDEPENLFLMCEDCHAESPDTTNREAFFRWVYRRRSEWEYGIHWKRLLIELEQEVNARGYDLVDISRKLEPKSGFEIAEIAMGRCGLHGTRIAGSSIAIAVADEMERRMMCEEAYIMEEKLIEYLDELLERGSDPDDLGKLAHEWIFGAIMGAYVMGAITMRKKNELLREYCGIGKPPVD